jgi:glycosyltransferase involved in cell wall biosynthesis
MIPSYRRESAKLRVSVIICTYNRAEMLSRTLESVRRLSVPADVDWELVVVDNNSPDRTKEAVSRFSEDMPIRYLFEPQQGKTFALNRAVRESTGDLLLFTDDDVQLQPCWLEEFVRAGREYPDAAWFGGRVCAWWADGYPKWLREDALASLKGYFVLYDLGPEERLYKPTDNAPIGANMAVRRPLFDAIGLYREDLGPRGDRRGTCDDSELIWRACAAGLQGVYVPNAVCEHYVPGNRLRVAKFLAYGLAKGEDQVAADPSCDLGSVPRAVLYAARGSYQLLKWRWDRFCLCCLNMGLELGGRRARKRRSGNA